MNVSGPVFAYRPAEMTIHTRSADIEMDWRRVWDSMGLENPLSFMRSFNQRSRQDSEEAVAQKARDGDRIARSVQKKEDNVFGNLALEKYKRDREPQFKLVAMPSTGPDITITTYKPEIHIEPQLPTLSRSGVQVQSIAKETSTFMNRQI